jgi:hypothetical protein
MERLAVVSLSDFYRRWRLGIGRAGHTHAGQQQRSNCNKYAREWNTRLPSTLHANLLVSA